MSLENQIEYAEMDIGFRGSLGGVFGSQGKPQGRSQGKSIGGGVKAKIISKKSEGVLDLLDTKANHACPKTELKEIKMEVS